MSREVCPRYVMPEGDTQLCPGCHMPLNSHALTPRQMTGENMQPKKGDVSACLMCGHPMVFTDDQCHLRTMTSEEFSALEEDQRHIILSAQEFARRSNDEPDLGGIPSEIRNVIEVAMEAHEVAGRALDKSDTKTAGELSEALSRALHSYSRERGSRSTPLGMPDVMVGIALFVASEIKLQTSSLGEHASKMALLATAQIITKACKTASGMSGAVATDETFL